MKTESGRESDGGVFASAMDKDQQDEAADNVAPLQSDQNRMTADLNGQGGKININYSAAKQSDFSSMRGAGPSIGGALPTEGNDGIP